MLRYLTGGESHGKGMTAILEGIPAGLLLKEEYINKELARRQRGYGRGGRMAIEKDRAEITSGIRWGKTLGSPITMLVENLDWENWKEIMSLEFRAQISELNNSKLSTVTRPRPGHADLTGALKYNHRDIRNVLERSSARETAARVAVGAVCKRLLDGFGIKVMSWVVEIGGVRCQMPDARCQKKGVLKGTVPDLRTERSGVVESGLSPIFKMAEESDVRCPDKDVEKKMKERVDEARERGDSVGGIFEIVVTGLPPGLGSHVHWDRKLDGCLAQAVMSIQAIKGVEVGLGFETSRIYGSAVHDEIFYRGQESGFYRKTNNAGGIEGGMSNGEPIVLRAVMKPIPTLMVPLKSVDIDTKESFDALKERSDVCAVPAASVVGEGVVAFEIARAFLEKFGGDSMGEVKRNYEGYLGQLREF